MGNILPAMRVATSPQVCEQAVYLRSVGPGIEDAAAARAAYRNDEAEKERSR